MKVVVTDYIEPNLDWEAEELRRAGHSLHAYQLKTHIEREVVAALQDADIIVVNMLEMTDSIISRLKKCRLMIRHGMGYDNVDVDSCTRHGIPFAHQPDYCVEDVAEHTVALILACARKIPLCRVVLDRSVAKGQWDLGALHPLQRMAGKTLGIVGIGRTGSRVARKVDGLGFRIVGHDPYLAETRWRELGVERVDMDTLLMTSDFVTIHTPLRDDTRQLMGARALRLMKKTAYLINTSRGPMVDIPALTAALRSGELAGAALDVFEREPPPADFPLYDFPNVILTPHVAWASEDSELQIREDILADILAACEGKPPRHQLNKGVRPR